MHITINAMESCKDIPDNMIAEETREMTEEDEHLSLWQNSYSIVGHPQN